MQNVFVMNTALDQQRQRNAALLTLGIGGAILVLFILLRWPIPHDVPQPVAEVIEINLGNSDVGSGDDHGSIMRRRVRTSVGTARGSRW